MTFFGLLHRNLRYHWRGNLAVFLGVALGSAVLTGALFVGDSLRGSLKELTLDQLGWVEHAMTPGRFFREKLAEPFHPAHAAPVLMLQASASTTNETTQKTKSIGKVTLLGIKDHFLDYGHGGKLLALLYFPNWSDSDPHVAVNQSLANELRVDVGDKVSFNVQKTDAAPRESLLGKRDDVVQSITVTVKKILPDQGMARFTLRPSPEPVRNAFVPLAFLQKELKLDGKANAILIEKTQTNLQEKLTKTLILEDWDLKLRTPANQARSLVRFLDPKKPDGPLARKQWEGRVPDEMAQLADDQGYLSLKSVAGFYAKRRWYNILESGQMFLDPSTERAAEIATERTALDTDPRIVTPLIYLADSIRDDQAEMPYAVIAAVPPAQLPAEQPATLKDDEIAIVTWPGMPLKAKQGDAVTITYYVPDDRNQLQKKTETFRVGLLMPLTGDADDPDWTPEFPGITDKLKISDWENPPFPYDAKRVKPIDEQYWKRYRATPKAYVTLATGQRLWASRFGKITSVRVPASVKGFEQELLAQLRPESGGFVFQNVREQAERSSSGSSDFGVLFLSFSFFLIAAALLLVGLLFRLNLDRRAAEMGLLLATGWSHRKVRWLLLAEGLALAVVGAAAGLLGALIYGSQMLQMLAANWPGGERLAFLRLHAEPMSFAIGYGASLVVSALTIVWATRVLGKMSPTSLLAGVTTANASGDRAIGKRRKSGIVIGVALVGAAACLIAGTVLEGHEAKAGSFFGAGALLLTASLALAWRWLVFPPSPPWDSGPGVRGGPKLQNEQPSLTRLGARNAGRHPSRSVLTVGLLASATFLIVAVEAFHKETGHEFFDKHGGSGGFTLIAETDVSSYRDLNDPKTQVQWNVTKEQAALLRGVKFHGLRVRHGDDASCLNLYQPLKPRILAVSTALRDESRFAFSARLNPSDKESANPWLLLDKTQDDGTIPVILDANTAQWILKVGLGETLEILDEIGDKVKLRVVALLKESIFQSEILIAESAFLKLFPRQEGFQVFLVETEPTQADAVREALQAALTDQGVQVVSTAQRLQSFLAVENMYLDTFKALGGLGLLLGAAGLSIVLLRGVWERRSELALLRALGFRGGQLAWLVLAENALLLALGLGAGTVAALCAVAPHLIGSGAAPLWSRLALLLGGVVLVGLLSGTAAVWGSLRTPLLTALRRE